MIGSFRARVCRAGAGASRRSSRSWLVLLLLALLADLSASAAMHRHPAHAGGPPSLQQGSAPASHAPGSPAGPVSLDDLCAICGALAGSVAACSSRIPLDLQGLLARTFAALPEPIFSAARGWWVSTASRAPPRLLF